MPNWGVPDFKDDVTLEQKQAIWQRIKAETKGEGLIVWPEDYKVEKGYPPADVQKHCVRDAEWQGVRLSMKGIPTHKKLEILKLYWDRKCAATTFMVKYIIEVQVGNYLGALRRGGQLDDHNRVRKYV